MIALSAPLRIEKLSMDMRFTCANMGTEMGALTSYIQPDAITRAWLDRHGTKLYTVYETDRVFAYDRVHEVDVSGIGPQIAIAHAPDTVRPVAAKSSSPRRQRGRIRHRRMHRLAAGVLVNAATNTTGGMSARSPSLEAST